jgi:transcriptional regulator with XRE-family HTH domain
MTVENQADVERLTASFADAMAETAEESDPAEWRSDVGMQTANAETPAYVWNRNPEFPAYLRRMRERAGLSIRQAAPALGLSVPYLSRFETGGPAKPPEVTRLFAMADLYGIDRREILVNAGVKLDIPWNLELVDNTDELFARMMLDPKLRPPLLTEEALHYVPPRLKAQFIQWARLLVLERDPAAYLSNLLKDERDP